MWRYLLLVVFIIGCNHKPDLEKERSTILKMLATEKDAHFKKDVDLFISEFADSMLNVNKGKVTAPSRDEHKEKISNYFNAVQFIKWDDIAEPLIRFSDDGSLAYAVVQKEVILSYPDSTGKPFYDTTHYAWTSIYRKHNDGWKIEANISTNK